MKLTPVEGYVWCDKLTEIHADCLDPYDYGEPTQAGFEDPRCKPSDHRKVYARYEDSRSTDDAS